MDRTIFLDEALEVNLENLLGILQDTAKGWDANVRYETLPRPKTFLAIYRDKFAKVRIAKQRTDISYNGQVKVLGFGTTHDTGLHDILLNEFLEYSLPNLPKPRRDENTVVEVSYIPQAESKIRVVIDSEGSIDDYRCLFYIATTYEVLRNTKGMQAAQSWWEGFKARPLGPTDGRTIEEYLQSQGVLVERNDSAFPRSLVHSTASHYYGGTLTELRAIVDWHLGELRPMHRTGVSNLVADANRLQISVTLPSKDRQVGVIEVSAIRENLLEITLIPRNAHKTQFAHWWSNLCFALWSDRLLERDIARNARPRKQYILDRRKAVKELSGLTAEQMAEVLGNREFRGTSVATINRDLKVLGLVQQRKETKKKMTKK